MTQLIIMKWETKGKNKYGKIKAQKDWTATKCYLLSPHCLPKNTETEWKEGKSDSSESRRTRVIKPGAWTRFLDGPGFPWGCGGLGSRNLKQSLDARVQGAPLLLLENKSKTEAHREDHAGHFNVLCPLRQQNLHWSRHQQALFFWWGGWVSARLFNRLSATTLGEPGPCPAQVSQPGDHTPCPLACWPLHTLFPPPRPPLVLRCKWGLGDSRTDPGSTELPELNSTFTFYLNNKLLR